MLHWVKQSISYYTLFWSLDYAKRYMLALQPQEANKQKQQNTTIPLTYHVVQLCYYSHAISVKYFISWCMLHSLKKNVDSKGVEWQYLTNTWWESLQLPVTRVTSIFGKIRVQLNKGGRWFMQSARRSAERQMDGLSKAARDHPSGTPGHAVF